MMINNSFYHNKSLNVGSWNCNSTSNKKILLNKFLQDNVFDIFCLNETKCKAKTTLQFNSNHVLQKNRKGKGGGGVALLVKDHLCYKKLNDLDEFNLELEAISIQTKNFWIKIICLYNLGLHLGVDKD